jgi:hypothetical protein
MSLAGRVTSVVVVVHGIESLNESQLCVQVFNDVLSRFLLFVRRFSVSRVETVLLRVVCYKMYV